MREVVRYLIVLTLLVFAATLLYYNRVAPPFHIVVISGSSLLLAGLLADPADMKDALASLVGAVGQYFPRKPSL